MAAPKSRVSRARGRKRRTHWKVKLRGVVSCPRCGEPKLPHRVCLYCGYYKDIKVIEGKEEEAR